MSGSGFGGSGALMPNAGARVGLMTVDRTVGNRLISQATKHGRAVAIAAIATRQYSSYRQQSRVADIEKLSFLLCVCMCVCAII